MCCDCADWINNEFLPENRRRLKNAHSLLTRELRSLGIPFLDRPAALYVWADLRKVIQAAESLSLIPLSLQRFPFSLRLENIVCICCCKSSLLSYCPKVSEKVFVWGRAVSMEVFPQTQSVVELWAGVLMLHTWMVQNRFCRPATPTSTRSVSYAVFFLLLFFLDFIKSILIQIVLKQPGLCVSKNG